MFEQLKKRVPERIGSENIKQFAVMIPLIRKEDGFHILFEVRSSKLAHQPGEICFPGGKQEGGESALETAVRETKEELLLNGENIRVYGALDYVLTGSNRRIDACLGELLHYQGQYSESEVASVFTVPLSFFREQKVSQRIFVLKYFYFESNRAIAEKYGFTERKVTHMLAHTRAQLKEYLIKEEIYL